ncbi:MAG: stage IV sporulation protein A [Ruminococcus sp.]|nr:stage IV sporulation protein A [Ruminococcus sp.]
MEERNVYQDISRRTDGDVYIGVVGPVRTGKSTFIKRFMDALVLPNIRDENIYRRTVDELPQSSAGKTIMTTEPKFIPEESVEISLDKNTTLNVRMIDCVGYIVNSAIGYNEEDMPRMVKTPWSENEIPFDDAAEIGTKKVITDHSTIGLVITTDGSFSDLPREDYIESEKRVIAELKAIDKPFIVLLNSIEPNSQSVQLMAGQMATEYQVPVLPVSCMELDENEIKRILAQLLFEFPIREIKVDIPKWVVRLDKEHWLKSVVFDYIRNSAGKTGKIREIQQMLNEVTACEYISSAQLTNLDLGRGYATISVGIDSALFYKVLSEQTELEISDECALLDCISRLSKKQKEFDKIAQAYEQVKESGYGIVMPTIDELTLEEPQIIKQSGKYGIKLKASAPSIHMMRIETQTEVTPIVGSEQQSEELVSYLLKEFEENPEKIWESNIFGKSVHELVNEGLHNKLYRMPSDARRRIGETIEKIINDGCNGLICIIL